MYAIVSHPSFDSKLQGGRKGLCLMYCGRLSMERNAGKSWGLDHSIVNECVFGILSLLPCESSEA